jgi:hypothetical protein
MTLVLMPFKGDCAIAISAENPRSGGNEFLERHITRVSIGIPFANADESESCTSTAEEFFTLESRAMMWDLNNFHSIHFVALQYFILRIRFHIASH